MKDPACGLRRMPLPRRLVNSAKKEGRSRQGPRPFSLTLTQERQRAAFSEGRLMSERLCAGQSYAPHVPAIAHLPPSPVAWQNCPAGQSQELLQKVLDPSVWQ